MRTSFLTVAAALALIAIAPPVLAAPDDPAGADTILEKSSQLYRKARALHTDAKWAEAEAAYQAAWDLRRTFDIAGNLGDCELHVGQPREAAEHLSYALANFPAGGTAQQKDALNQRIQAAQKQIGTLHVRVNVAGAQLFVDGRPVLELPDGLVFVDRGARTIEARHPGYETGRKTITAQAGSTQDVTLTLVASQTPTSQRSVIPGAVLGSIAGAALVTGISLFAAGHAKEAGVRDTHDAILKAHHSCVTGAANYDPRCEDVQSSASTGNAFQKAGVGLLVGAGAAAIGTVIYFVAPPSRSPAASTGVLRVMPALAPSTGGLVFSGSF